MPYEEKPTSRSSSLLKKLSALTPGLTQHPMGDPTVQKDSLGPGSHGIPSRPPASSPEPLPRARLQQLWVAPGPLPRSTGCCSRLPRGDRSADSPSPWSLRAAAAPSLPLHLNKGSAALHRGVLFPTLAPTVSVHLIFRHLRLSCLQNGASGLYYLTLHDFKKWLKRL